MSAFKLKFQIKNNKSFCFKYLIENLTKSGKKEIES